MRLERVQLLESHRIPDFDDALIALAWTPAISSTQLYFDRVWHNASALDFLWFPRSLYSELKHALWDRLGTHRKAARVL